MVLTIQATRKGGAVVTNGLPARAAIGRGAGVLGVAAGAAVQVVVELVVLVQQQTGI